jgi:hypothetical protein
MVMRPMATMAQKTVATIRLKTPGETQRTPTDSPGSPDSRMALAMVALTHQPIRAGAVPGEDRGAAPPEERATPHADATQSSRPTTNGSAAALHTIITAAKNIPCEAIFGWAGDFL